MMLNTFGGLCVCTGFLKENLQKVFCVVHFFSTTKLTKMLPASTLTVNLLLSLVFSCASVTNFVCTFVL